MAWKTPGWEPGLQPRSDGLQPKRASYQMIKSRSLLKDSKSNTQMKGIVFLSVNKTSKVCGICILRFCQCPTLGGALSEDMLPLLSAKKHRLQTETSRTKPTNLDGYSKFINNHSNWITRQIWIHCILLKEPSVQAYPDPQFTGQMILLWRARAKPIWSRSRS